MDSKPDLTETHFHNRVTFDSNVCSCGAKLCLALHLTKEFRCMLTKGHDGPHMNQCAPNEGTW